MNTRHHTTKSLSARRTWQTTLSFGAGVALVLFAVACEPTADEYDAIQIAVKMANGGSVVATELRPFEGGPAELRIHRVDTTGMVEWALRRNDELVERSLVGVTPTTDGGVVVTAVAVDPADDRDQTEYLWGVKLDRDGETVWEGYVGEANAPVPGPPSALPGGGIAWSVPTGDLVATRTLTVDAIGNMTWDAPFDDAEDPRVDGLTHIR